ncbi:hypothetical protein DLM75_06155 [Leptospira stimsonii]|uniref:Uncharacterized protein n=1 Tax=Leptospira stimsonii TaxID=2202203 RepID=A0A396ZBV9_9LEPT|nr:hypothetical protein DLM75_06155 [Leptospira stimsonii]
MTRSDLLPKGNVKNSDSRSLSKSLKRRLPSERNSLFSKENYGEEYQFARTRSSKKNPIQRKNRIPMKSHSLTNSEEFHFLAQKNSNLLSMI